MATKRRTQQDGPPVGELLRRDPLQADVRAVESAAGRQVELSFSSEEPVQRWWGCTPGAWVASMTSRSNPRATPEAGGIRVSACSRSSSSG